MTSLTAERSDGLTLTIIEPVCPFSNSNLQVGPYRGTHIRAYEARLEARVFEFELSQVKYSLKAGEQW